MYKEGSAQDEATPLVKNFFFFPLLPPRNRKKKEEKGLIKATEVGLDDLSFDRPFPLRRKNPRRFSLLFPFFLKKSKGPYAASSTSEGSPLPPPGRPGPDK